MAEVAARTDDWHVGRSDGPSEWQGGPYTWDQLIAFAREGRISASDLVWHPTMPAWIPAQRVPGLLVQPGAAAPQAATAPPRAPTPSGAPAPPEAPPPPTPTQPLASAPTFVSQAAAAATSVSSAHRTAARAAGMATNAAGVISLPWQTIVTGQSVDVRGMLRAAAPSLLARAPRPNLRRPALAIAFTLVMQVGIALIAGGAVSLPMLALRLLPGIATSVLGFIAGGKAGSLRKATGLVAVVFGVVQLASLLQAAYQAIATPVTLLALVPSIIAVVAGLVLAVFTAIAGFRK